MYRQAWVTAAALAMSVLASGSGLATPAWAPLAGKNIRVEYRVTETSKVTTSGKLAGKTARETKVQVCKERNNYYVSDEGRIFWSVLLIAARLPSWVKSLPPAATNWVGVIVRIRKFSGVYGS